MYLLSKVKVKVRLSLCFFLNWASRHEGVLGERMYSLTSALDGDKWSASRPGRFTLRERAPGTQWIGGWVGPRAVLVAVVKRKIPTPRRESNPITPIVQPVAQRYTDWAIMALYLLSSNKNLSKKLHVTVVGHDWPQALWRLASTFTFIVPVFTI
jgi:hypothetical protein